MDIKTKMGHEGVPYLNDIGTVPLCRLFLHVNGLLSVCDSDTCLSGLK